MISFWLFLFAAIFTLYLYFKKKIPVFLGHLIFFYSFVYGFGSAIFYILFMIFVRGVTVYHVWNIFAHGFVGLQALLFLYKLKKPRISYILFLGLLFFSKDVFDMFGSSFLYFTEFSFNLTLKLILFLMIFSLQLLAIYLLFRIDKRLK